ncbi:formate dehydrogenase subunit gamma [Zhengella sp. ZM62]|uniref:formate dehydrogenase subunit gamma n=1 Tax=Zhengella sedimenti TaxID=3390035 RepID=UPI003975EA57
MPEPGPASDIVERTRKIVTGHAGRLGPLLPILHDVQHAFGHLPDEALRTVADGLNLSRAEVHGVASFYHDFRDAPAGRHVLKICRAEACQASGGDAIAERAASRLKIAFGETTADGAVTLEAVYCLGLCACGPAAMIDGRVAGRLDDARLDALLAEAGQ